MVKHSDAIVFLFYKTIADWPKFCKRQAGSHNLPLKYLFTKREFHNKVPPDKMPLLCRKFCVINKPFTENIVYFCL